eukprot:13399572-Alexandrium_andersonii.AAC.1
MLLIRPPATSHLIGPFGPLPLAGLERAGAWPRMSTDSIASPINEAVLTRPAWSPVRHNEGH